MPKYMEAADAAYAAVTESIGVLDEDGQNKAEVLAALNKLKEVSEETVANVRVSWQKTAMERVGALGTKAIIEVTDANDQGEIVPPLTESEFAVLAMRRTMYAALVEGSGSNESNRPTPTDRMPTDNSKS